MSELVRTLLQVSVFLTTQLNVYGQVYLLKTCVLFINNIKLFNI